jgi:hypothetical protein
VVLAAVKAEVTEGGARAGAPPAAGGAAVAEEVPGATNLTGRWVLDRVRSESMEPYLRAMGLPPLAIEAAAKAEEECGQVVTIEQNDATFTIGRKSRLNNFTKTYPIGEMTTELVGKTGSKQVKVSLDGPAVLTHTIMAGDKQLFDRRRVMAGGATMHLVLHLVTPQADVEINRYLARQDGTEGVEDDIPDVIEDELEEE